MKTFKFLLIIFVLIFILTGCGKNSNTQDEKEKNPIAGNEILTDTTNNSTDTNIQNAENRINNIIASQTQSTPTVLSTYSTVIKDNSAGRLTNISITCNTLNRNNCRT